jgi:hypothetical protein
VTKMFTDPRMGTVHQPDYPNWQVATSWYSVTGVPRQHARGPLQQRRGPGQGGSGTHARTPHPPRSPPYSPHHLPLLTPFLLTYPLLLTPLQVQRNSLHARVSLACDTRGSRGLTKDLKDDEVAAGFLGGSSGHHDNVRHSSALARSDCRIRRRRCIPPSPTDLPKLRPSVLRPTSQSCFPVFGGYILSTWWSTQRTFFAFVCSKFHFVQREPGSKAR